MGSGQSLSTADCAANAHISCSKGNPVLFMHTASTACIRHNKRLQLSGHGLCYMLSGRDTPSIWVDQQTCPCTKSRQSMPAVRVERQGMSWRAVARCVHRDPTEIPPAKGPLQGSSCLQAQPPRGNSKHSWVREKRAANRSKPALHACSRPAKRAPAALAW